MEFLKQWAISICACGIIGTVFSMIAPKGSMEKILNLVIAVFIFTSILTPFLKIGDINFDFGNSNISSEKAVDDMVEKSNEITMASASLSVQKVVLEFLKNNDLADSKANVEMERDNENNISIKNIKIFLSKENIAQADNVKLLVESEFKSNTEVFGNEDLTNE